MKAPLVRLTAVSRDGLVLETGTACSWHQSRVRSEHSSTAGAETKRLAPGTTRAWSEGGLAPCPWFPFTAGLAPIAADASQLFPLARVPPRLGTTPHPRSEGRLALRAEWRSWGEQDLVSCRSPAACGRQSVTNPEIQPGKAAGDFHGSCAPRGDRQSMRKMP